MALFGNNNQEKEQKRMFDAELQSTREENAVKYSDVGDDVYFQQKEKTEELTKWQQNLELDIELTVHDLKREVRDKDGNYKPMLEFTGKFREVDGKKKRLMRRVKPIMNDIGLNDFRGIIRPLTSRNLMMSNYNEDKIFVKLRSIMFTFISHIAYYHKTYEIDVGNLSIIVRMFKDIAEPAHWRAMNNGERSYLNTINKRIEAVAYGQPQQGQQKKGFLSGLMG